MNNNTFKIQDVKKLLEEDVEQVTSDMWKNVIAHIIKEEEKFWQVDFISDEMLDKIQGSHILTITGDTDSDSDDFE